MGPQTVVPDAVLADYGAATGHYGMNAETVKYEAKPCQLGDQPKG